MSTNTIFKSAVEAESDHVWGATAIGREINRTPQQVYYLFGCGALDGAVIKMGHRTLLGSRRELARLVSRGIAATAVRQPGTATATTSTTTSP